MSNKIELTITIPTAVLVSETDVRAIRAEDESGSFGVLPGHADLLTVLPSSVVRWYTGSGLTRYCALRGGVLTVEGGHRVEIACRQGAVGDDLMKLEADVDQLRAAEVDVERRMRVEQMCLHARAVRQLMHYLRPRQMGGAESPVSTGVRK